MKTETEDLRTTREIKGLTRKFVAKEYGVSADHLNYIERGCQQLKVLEIKKFATIYNIPFSQMAEIALATYERRNLND